MNFNELSDDKFIELMIDIYNKRTEDSFDKYFTDVNIIPGLIERLELSKNLYSDVKMRQKITYLIKHMKSCYNLNKVKNLYSNESSYNGISRSEFFNDLFESWSINKSFLPYFKDRGNIEFIKNVYDEKRNSLVHFNLSYDKLKKESNILKNNLKIISKILKYFENKMIDYKYIYYEIMDDMRITSSDIKSINENLKLCVYADFISNIRLFDSFIFKFISLEDIIKFDKISNIYQILWDGWFKVLSDSSNGYDNSYDILNDFFRFYSNGSYHDYISCLNDIILSKNVEYSIFSKHYVPLINSYSFSCKNEKNFINNNDFKICFCNFIRMFSKLYESLVNLDGEFIIVLNKIEPLYYDTIYATFALNQITLDKLHNKLKDDAFISFINGYSDYIKKNNLLFLETEIKKSK